MKQHISKSLEKKVRLKKQHFERIRFKAVFKRSILERVCQSVTNSKNWNTCCISPSTEHHINKGHCWRPVTFWWTLATEKTPVFSWKGLRSIKLLMLYLEMCGSCCCGTTLVTCFQTCPRLHVKHVLVYVALKRHKTWGFCKNPFPTWSLWRTSVHFFHFVFRHISTLYLSYVLCKSSCDLVFRDKWCFLH